MKVLFVCSGNICRSPMAAEYLRQRAASFDLSHLVVDSAGTLGIVDRPASADAIRVMDEIGIDLHGHRSKGLEAEMFQTADLIVAMSHEHLAEMAHRFPAGAGDRLLLRAFEESSERDPNARDLDDPIGRSVEFYRQVRERITRSVDHLALHLKHLA